MHRRTWLILFTGILIAQSAGCGSAEPEVTPDAGSKSQVQTDVVDEISLKELLTKPRAALALLADECQEKINFLEEKHQVGSLPFRRLPELRLPLATPGVSTSKILRQTRLQRAALPGGGRQG